MNTKVLAILRNAYEEIINLEEWCVSVLKACGDATVNVVTDTDSIRYKEFLKTTLVGTPPDLNWFGARVCFTNTLSQHELLIQAIERIHRKEGSGKNLLTLGCSNMSSNPSAQVSVSRSFESVFPNQNINILLQHHWKTLLTRIGDDLMLHLLTYRSVFCPVNTSCCIQITGTPLYDLWPFLRNVKVKLPEHTKNGRHRNIVKLKLHNKKRRKKKQARVGQVSSVESMSVKDNNNQSGSRMNKRKRKRGSQTSSLGSTSQGSAKRSRLLERSWRSNSMEELTTWQQQDVNAGFCEMDDEEVDLTDDITENDTKPSYCVDVLEETLYTTAAEFPAYLLDESLKDTEENVLGRQESGDDMKETIMTEGGKNGRFNNTAGIKERLLTNVLGEGCLGSRLFEKDSEIGLKQCTPKTSVSEVNKDSTRSSYSEMQGPKVDCDMECFTVVDSDPNKKHDCDKAEGNWKVEEVKVSTTEVCSVDCVLDPDAGKLTGKTKQGTQNLQKRRKRKRKKGKESGHKKIKTDSVPDATSVTPNPPHQEYNTTFQPYMYHTYFHRNKLFYSKSLRENLPSNSPLTETCECPATVAKQLVQNMMVNCNVARSCDENNTKQLKCQSLIEERLGKIMEELVLNHRRIHYKKTLSQLIPLPQKSKNAADPMAVNDLTVDSKKKQGHCMSKNQSEGCTADNTVNKPDTEEKDYNRGLNVEDLLGCYVLPRKIYLFIRKLLKTLLPSQLLGSQRNEHTFLKGVQHLLSLGKYEKFCLGQVTSKIKITEVKWLPRKLPHVAKEFVIAKLIFWLMDRYVFVILKSFFYITDTTMYRNRLFYYRKAVWSRLRKLTMERYSKGGMLEEIPETQAQTSLTNGQALGYAQLRLLPKRASVRPIVNLGKRNVSGPNKGLTINGQLRNILQVLTYIKNRKPELMGCSQFGASDIYNMWKQFVVGRRERLDYRPLYFVKVDIENCYDSIDQKKLFEIISNNLRQENMCEEYIIRRFATLHIANNQLKRTFRRDVTSLDQFEPDFSRFVKDLCRVRNSTGIVFVDQVMHMHETNEHILEKLRKHLFNNIIQIGKKFYRQQVGISQGSILSTMLCNSYYGNMEHQYLKLSSDELLMRQVDDFLLVTPYVEHAKEFLTLMSTGISEYNCVVSRSKSLVNFDLDITEIPESQVTQLPDNALFPWCGMLINPLTLDVITDYSRCSGLKMSDVVTFDLTHKLGETLQGKLFRGLTSRNWLLCLDPDIAKDATLTLSVFKLFYMAALKFHSYMQKLPWRQGIQQNPLFFLKIIASLPVYLYNKIRCKLTSTVQRPTHVTSQNALYWLCLESFHIKLSAHTSQYGRSFLKELKRIQKEKQRKLTAAVVEDFINITRNLSEEFTAGMLC